MTIVCGTDFSSSADAACEAAAQIASSTGDTLLVVHAHPGAAGGQDAANAKRLLDDLAARLSGNPVHVLTALMSGPPDEALLAAAVDSDARLIVLGSVGQHGLRLVLGSTTDSIASRATIPVLVMRSGFPASRWLERHAPLRVALAADLGPSTGTAVEWASQLAVRGPCDFTVLHVSWPPADTRLDIDAPMRLDLTHPLVEEIIHRELSDVASLLKGVTETRVVTETNTGRTDTALADLADRERADLLVVGRGPEEGRQRWERSVSRAVVRHAPMSVVCVPQIAQVPSSAPRPARRVLCATDFSTLGTSAALRARSLLSADGQLTLIHVLPADATSDDEQVARQRLDMLSREIGHPTEIHILRGHDPARRITDSADELEADVICIGLRGHAPLANAMVGSVAQGILLRTRRPVLMVTA